VCFLGAPLTQPPAKACVVVVSAKDATRRETRTFPIKGIPASQNASADDNERFETVFSTSRVSVSESGVTALSAFAMHPGVFFSTLAPRPKAQRATPRNPADLTLPVQVSGDVFCRPAGNGIVPPPPAQRFGRFATDSEGRDELVFADALPGDVWPDLGHIKCHLAVTAPRSLSGHTVAVPIAFLTVFDAVEVRSRVLAPHDDVVVHLRRAPRNPATQLSCFYLVDLSDGSLRKSTTLQASTVATPVNLGNCAREGRVCVVVAETPCGGASPSTPTASVQRLAFPVYQLPDDTVKVDVVLANASVGPGARVAVQVRATWASTGLPVAQGLASVTVLDKRTTDEVEPRLRPVHPTVATTFAHAVDAIDVASAEELVVGGNASTVAVPAVARKLAMLLGTQADGKRKSLWTARRVDRPRLSDFHRLEFNSQVYLVTIQTDSAREGALMLTGVILLGVVAQQYLWGWNRSPARLCLGCFVLACGFLDLWWMASPQMMDAAVARK
jgi:hypothetical protein